ncbi:pectinesterase family protein [Paenibacillus sp. GD4]|uniref:pectinesterase family protein n=1 Tax=Paenibacillus sp. GD4 TaxID=3068890 RepID=UPI0027969436|nr:pectinesterase family protein [Paenibacillus sp. GD4]MDQ1909045.1 pectinesterase family protein [Paenibacillus sp. GD4]
MQIIVAQDGTGDYTRIQEAIDHSPDHSKEPILIYIKNGEYREKLHIEKPWITLLGESAESTVIAFDDYAKKVYPSGELYNTFNSYSVLIGANDFTAKNLTIANTSGSGDLVGQAVAAYVDGDRIVFDGCRLLGHQDTLFTGPLPEQPMDRSTFGGPKEGAPRVYGRQYYKNCYIEGDVDFIFGSAIAVFEQCEIFSKKRSADHAIQGYITAASTPEHLSYGYVFHQCKLTGDAPKHSVYLGRPWRIHAKTAFINCWMGEHIHPEGWHNWNKLESEQTTRYCEYNNTGPGATTDARVNWSHQLTPEKAGAYAVRDILAGQDGWNPEVDV